MLITQHPTSQHAWEWINEYLVTREQDVLDNGGYRKGPQMISYDHFMEINKSWVDPNFDFGKMFGYKMAKWNKLISNYIDFDFLDIAKSQVQEREQKKHTNYSVVFKFSNTHSSGHACLVSLIFQRREGYDTPLVIMNIRSSEVTKRLLMDFVLVDRIISYVYGGNHQASLKVYIVNAYIAGETFTMYHGHRDLFKLLKGNETEIATRVLKILNKYLEPDALKKITYKSHQRAIKRLAGDDINPLLSQDLCILPNYKAVKEKRVKRNTINNK